MKQIVIIPIDHIQELYKNAPDLKNFFRQISLQSIIEIIIEVDSTTDISSVLWAEVEHKLTDDELEKLDIVNLDFLFEMIINLFYEELYRNTGCHDIAYSLYHWMPDCICLLKKNTRDRSNEEFNPLHYPTSPF